MNVLPRSMNSPSFEELVRETKIKLPSFELEGTYFTDAITPPGKFDSDFKV